MTIEKNVYYKINETEARLVVTKLDGSFFRFRIDTEDIPLLSKYTWHMKKDMYLYTQADGKTMTPGEILFHRREKGMVFDHIDRDSFNYAKSNLRYVNWKTNLNNRWKPRTKDGDVYGIFKTKYGYRTRAADGTFPTFQNWMDAAVCRVEYLIENGGSSKLEAIKKLDFDDLDDWEFMVDLCTQRT